MNAAEIGIAVPEDDHVLRLAGQVLAWRDAADRGAARDFFLPEAVPDAEIAAIAAPLRQRGSVMVSDGAAGLAEAHVLLTRRSRVDAALIARAPNLRLVQRLGVETGTIDLAAARSRGIPVSCLPRQTLEQVADHAMMLILMLLRGYRAADPRMRGWTEAGTAGAVAYNWTLAPAPRGAAGLTLGIVGLGEVGRHLARRAAGFGMRLLYTKRTPLTAAEEAGLGAVFRPFDALLAESDVVSLHVPPAGLPGPLLGDAEFAAMKPGAVLINTARGALLDEAALLAALRSGRLAGAGLDVHLCEPRPADDPLMALDNVVLTPHLAGGARSGVMDEVRRIAQNIAAALDGRPLPHGAVP